jgi:peptidoglycan/LPS O-acetylase OafA/YrhL
MAQPRNNALDGLRGIAVLLVLAFHARLPGFAGGFLGVSIFFTLSGFLITRLLLDEYATTADLDLPRFLLRRARRLLPASLLLVLLLALTGQVTQYDVFGAVFYHSNWQQIWSSNDYSALFATEPMLLHFWSLAIEEQYYLLFPVLLLVALRRLGSRRGPLLLIGLVLVLSTLGYLANLYDPLRTYYGSDTRAGEIAIGSLLALLLHHRPGVPARALTRMASPALALVLFLVYISTTTSSWVARGGLLGFALLSCALILGALRPGLYARLLAASPLRHTGVISYGLYLYHWPVFVLFGTGTPPRLLLALTTTYLLALFSYRYLEYPIRSGLFPTKIFLPTTLTLILAIGLGAGWGGWRTGSSGEDCFYGNDCPPTGTAWLDEPDSATPKILVLGDSVAQVTSWGLRHTKAASAEEVQIVGLGAGGCPMFGSAYRWHPNATGPWNKNCDLEAAIETIRTWRPDVVLVMFTLSNQVDVQVGSTWTNLTEPAGRAAFTARAESLIAAASAAGSTIWWSDAPTTTPQSKMLAPAATRATAHNEAIDALLDEHPAIERFPLRSVYTQIPSTDFRDGVHLTHSRALIEAETWQLPRLLTSLRR